MTYHHCLEPPPGPVSGSVQGWGRFNDLPPLSRSPTRPIVGSVQGWGRFNVSRGRTPQGPQGSGGHSGTGSTGGSLGGGVHFPFPDATHGPALQVGRRRPDPSSWSILSGGCFFTPQWVDRRQTRVT